MLTGALRVCGEGGYSPKDERTLAWWRQGPQRSGTCLLALADSTGQCNTFAEHLDRGPDACLAIEVASSRPSPVMLIGIG